MFEIADMGLAVAGAVPSLKKMASGILGGNNEDSVAKWLADNVLPFSEQV